MLIAPDPLPEKTDFLKDIINEQAQKLAEKNQHIEQQKKRIEILEEYIRYQKQQRFGASSEKSIDQFRLFDEVEVYADDAVEEDIDPPSTTAKAKRGRKPFPKDLPRVQIHWPLTDEEKVGAVDTFFVKVKEEIDIIPATVRILEYFQEKAVFIEEGERKVKTAERPLSILPKTMASVSLLAYIMVSKYCDGLPLYRVEKMLQRYGITIARATLANWVIGIALQIQPLLNLMREHLHAGPLINMDETPLQVLKEPDKPPSSKSYMWVQAGGDSNQWVVLFDYDPTRCKEVPLRLLEGYCGHLQTDGYSGYDAVCKAQSIIQLGCWDHVRRKFRDAQKAMPKKHKNTQADRAVRMIKQLYKIERELKNSTDEHRQQQRQLRSIPVLNKIRAWLEFTLPMVPKESLTGKALHYMNNQWPKLIVYCEKGFLPISNCKAENKIRPFVIGRNAWLFSDTPKGAHASASLYSMIETAKANGLEPFHYLKYVFEKLPQAKTVENIEALLPWHIEDGVLPKLKVIPQYVRN